MVAKATTKRKSRQRQLKPLSPDEALSMLRSAVGYVVRAGLPVYAGNIGGRLIISIAGARKETTESGMTFVTVPDGSGATTGDDASA